MTLSQLRRRIDALKRKFARELAIIQLRRIAEALADAWDPDNPPEPAAVIRRVADAGFRLTTFGRLGHCLRDARHQGDPPDPEYFVCSLLPWAENDRYYKLLRWDLPAGPRSADHSRSGCA